ncbi:MAG: NADH-quinone oxidoreductase subunit M [Magnetococcales bacterium]|nr:NADH-quinone oxidoreductase subunit M [Magnetococcales bacterium]
MNPFPWLSLLISLPLVGALLVWVGGGRWARSIATGCAVATLGVALGVAGRFEPGVGTFQLVERHAWMPSLHSAYLVGVDGISLPFLPMIALLFVATILAGWHHAQRPLSRLHFALLLFLEGVTLGIFCALDTVLFFLFWELTLIPIYFLVSLWGVGPNRRHAASKYTLYMLAGGAPLLFGLLLPALSDPGGMVFDLTELLARPLPPERQGMVFFLLLVGFGVKIPLVPLHAWLPTLALEGPVGVTAIMTGVKLGAYGLIRFVLPLAPDVAREYHWLLAGLGVVAIIYGGLAALAQSNLRRMLAFSSISHVGLVVLGVSSFTLQGVQGALYQLLNFTLTAGGLFLLGGFLHQRLGSTDLVHMGGLVRPLPWVATFFLLFGLAGMGMPLTSGFPGELLLLVGVFQAHTGSGLAALGGVILGAGCFFSFFRQGFLGPLGRHVPGELPPLLLREWLVLIPFGVLILLGGVYPSALLDVTHASAQHWLTSRVAPR